MVSTLFMFLCVRVHACLHICVYIMCVRVRACIFVCICACAHACMYVCAHVFVCACVHACVVHMYVFICLSMHTTTSIYTSPVVQQFNNVKRVAMETSL